MTKEQAFEKLTSRKFWLCGAAFLGSLGSGIAGIASGNEKLAMVGMVCTVLSGAIYAACETKVDSERIKAYTIAEQRTITASSSDKATVQAALDK